MKLVIAAIAAALMTGCAGGPELLASNQRSVVVIAKTTSEALVVADAECAKSGLKARIDYEERASFGRTRMSASCVR